MVDKTKWIPIGEKNPVGNKIVELKAEIVFHARYQPYSKKQEWKALSDGIETITVLAWRDTLGDGWSDDEI